MQQVLSALHARLGIHRTVKLLNSVHVQGPIVIGWFKPAILLPVGCMTGLSTLQIEAVLAHELAHIRRHDYLVNLLQSAVEVVLFYHPAIWWVSKEICREREHCCDDLAVAICGDRLAYAKALSSLEARRNSVPAGALAATGGAFKMRITRLLGLHQPVVFSSSAVAILLMFVITTAGLTVWGSVQGQTMPSQKGTTPSEEPPGKTQHTQSSPPAVSIVYVRTLTIDSNDLPSFEHVQIVQTFQGTTYPLEELTERIRRDLQDRGYARATVDLVKPASLPIRERPQSANVLVRASAGIRYTLSNISVEGEHILSQEAVLKLFPIHPGEQFSSTAISDGLVRLRDLYVAKGYSEFTAVPDLQTDDGHHLATVTISINEGKTIAQ